MANTTISRIMESMIAFSDGNIRDINHLICVWGYAKTIGELEQLDRDTQFILEVAAITHDIACRCVAGSTAMQTASSRKKRAIHWCGASCQTRD